jgi:MraZ protein
VFVGTYERQLDDKGRLALPAPFRAQLGQQCYLSFGANKCVTVIPTASFEDLAAEVKRKVSSGEMSVQRQRALAASATLVTLDKQGRVTLEEKLRDYAGLALSSAVIVAGNFDAVEVWTPERHAAETAAGQDEIAGSPLVP